MHQCSASIHRERGGGGGSEQRMMFMWRYWPHSFTWKRRGTWGGETSEGNWVCEAQIARWTLNLISVLYKRLLLYMWVFVCLHSCRGILHVWVCVDLGVYKSVCAHVCVSKQFGSVLSMFAYFFFFCFFFFFFCPWFESQQGAMFSTALFQSRSDPTLPPLPPLPPAILSSNNMVKIKYMVSHYLKHFGETP